MLAAIEGQLMHFVDFSPKVAQSLAFEHQHLQLATDSITLEADFAKLMASLAVLATKHSFSPMS